MLSIFLCEPLAANEAIMLVGAERISLYSGYGMDFAYRGEVTDERYCDTLGRL